MRQKLISLIGDDDPRVLKIFYYAGHGSQDRLSAMTWANEEEADNIITWGGRHGLQALLEQARPDVLIILECCFALNVKATGLYHSKSPTLSSAGNTWLMAVCAHNAAIKASAYSLTSVLLRELPVLATFRRMFSVEELYRQILQAMCRPENLEWETASVPILVLLSSSNTVSQQVWLRPLPPTAKPVKPNTQAKGPLCRDAVVWDRQYQPVAATVICKSDSPFHIISCDLVQKLGLAEQPLNPARPFKNGIGRTVLVSRFVNVKLSVGKTWNGALDMMVLDAKISGVIEANTIILGDVWANLPQ
ncbi:hypothetical protein MMC17_001493 [Xylographa soralifera]|nr:hypothetical protein [Xylographa soralifera]